MKRGLHTNPDTQSMEDALCLSFLEFELDEFAAKHADDKVVDIIQKTWGKMSERGHSKALELTPSLPPKAAALVQRALAEGSTAGAGEASSPGS